MPRIRWPALAVVTVAAAALLVTTAVSAPSERRHSLYRPCFGDSHVGTIANGVIRYCGPANARLSVFPGVRFQNGSCYFYSTTSRSGWAGVVNVELGSRSFNRKTNKGLRYMVLSAAALPRPNGTSVTAYSKGKRWHGAIVSPYDGKSHAGRFVARGDQGSHGRATGSFRCGA